MPGARLEVRLRLKRYGAPAGGSTLPWRARRAAPHSPAEAQDASPATAGHGTTGAPEPVSPGARNPDSCATRDSCATSARPENARPAGAPPRSSGRSGEVAVLGPVAFDAAAGEVLAIFGPSGTGKSTLLRIVLGLDRAFEGSVAPPPGPAGVVFQEPRLAPWLDVAANLRLVAPSLDAAAIAAQLAPLGLAGTERMRPAALSLGMQRRVALARALAIRPQWLVLDEPFASLDPGLAAALGAIVARHARDTGAIVLMATHELDQALTLATRILVLSGRPATLAADIAVPAGDRSALRAELLVRFAFLGGGA